MINIRLSFGITLIALVAKKAASTTCSCFSIHEEGVTWPDARKSCQYYGGDLVSMETEHEWQVLKDQIENRTNRFNNSWHIGLRMKSTGIWTWLSGKPLTVNRWYPWQPRDGAPYAVVTKSYAPETKGLFRNVKGSIFAGFICEKPTECSSRRIICKDQGNIVQSRDTSLQDTTKGRNSESVIMVEKGQPPNGYIHWTVTVIPLGSVIAALLCVIVFLLWRLKYKAKKQIGAEITVSPMHYDVQTRSILKEVSTVKNGQGSNTATRVHFQEPKNEKTTSESTRKNVDMADGTSLLPNLEDRSIPRRLAIKRKLSNYKELEESYPLDQGEGEIANKVDCAIMRRLAIRRKNSNELPSKYPLNTSENEAGKKEKEKVNSYENQSNRDDAVPKSPRQTHQVSDYKELHEVV